MRIAIIGAGHLGYIIAEFLSNEQYDVVVVDSGESKLDAIRDALDVLTIHADGTSPSFMRDEDMKGTDIVVAVTAIDEVNIIACILAKKNGIPPYHRAYQGPEVPCRTAVLHQRKFRHRPSLKS